MDTQPPSPLPCPEQTSSSWLSRGRTAAVRNGPPVPYVALARLRSYGYVQTTDPSYLLSVAGRGADALGFQLARSAAALAGLAAGGTLCLRAWFRRPL
jgi:hypothetical protein